MRTSDMGTRGLMESGIDIDRTPRRLRAVPGAALVLALCLGCAAEPDPDVSDGAAEPASAEPADTGVAADTAVPADERSAAPGSVLGSAWTAGDTNVERPYSGAALLRDIRTAQHAGFDRIVLDFGTGPVPGYRVSWVDRPVRQCGSGEEVPLAGAGWLSITLVPANAHTDAGEPTVRERERAPGLPSLLELKLICDFEAQVEVVAGVASPERYRAFVLESPGRLVVDIMHAGGTP